MTLKKLQKLCLIQSLISANGDFVYMLMIREHFVGRFLANGRADLWEAMPKSGPLQNIFYNN